MAAVHHRDPSEDSCLPPISEITSDAFVLPLLSPQNSIPPQPTSGDLPPPLAPSRRPPFGGHPDQSPITHRAPAVIGKLERRVWSPVKDYGGYPCVPNPTGQLPSGQMSLRNGLFLPRPEHYNAPSPQTPAKPVPEADKQREAVPGLVSRTRAVMNFVDVLHRDFREQRLPSDNKFNEAIANAEYVKGSLEQLRDYLIRHSSGIMLHDPVNEVKNPVDEAKRRRRRPAPGDRCHGCDRTDSPEWRRGPNCARTLCNACGLRYAKLERKRTLEGIGSTDNS